MRSLVPVSVTTTSPGPRSRVLLETIPLTGAAFDISQRRSPGAAGVQIDKTRCRHLPSAFNPGRINLESSDAEESYRPSGAFFATAASLGAIDAQVGLDASVNLSGMSIAMR
jgi:hypothetical protein